MKRAAILFTLLLTCLVVTPQRMGLGHGNNLWGELFGTTPPAPPDTTNNYYVDGVGTGDTLATIAEVNAIVAELGDTFLLKRNVKFQVVGGVANSALVLNTYSGTSDFPIVYTNYGSGDLPIITARDTLEGWSVAGNWSDEGGNIWKLIKATPTGSQQLNRLFLNNSEAPEAASTAGVNATYPWRESVNNDTVFVYATENPSTFYSNIEDNGPHIDPVTLSNVHHIVVDGLDIRGGSDRCFGMFGGGNITIKNSDIGLFSTFAYNGKWNLVTGNWCGGFYLTI